MANDFREDEDFSPEILAAFADYPAPIPSRGFTERFWTQWELRRHRYRGFSGLLRRVWEVEIEGVAVWRLAVSTLSGGAICALMFSLMLGSSAPKNLPPLSVPQPQNEIPSTAMSAYAFYNRDWENDFGPAKTGHKTAPLRIQPRGGEISWTGSNGHLA